MKHLTLILTMLNEGYCRFVRRTLRERLGI